MKVYIVEEIEYNESFVHGVFSTQQKAQEYVDSKPQSEIHGLPAGPCHYLDIQGIEVDNLVDWTK